MESQKEAAEVSGECGLQAPHLSKATDIAHPPKSSWHFYYTDKDDLAHESCSRPRSNLYKLVSICMGFFVIGMTDSSLGVLIHSLEKYYKKPYSVISLTFIAPAVGYLTAALLNERFHRRIGRHGVGVLGTSCLVVCFVTLLCKPPLALLIISYGISGFGNGCVEASWTSWIGEFPESDGIMAILYGCHGLGGIFCPLVVTAMLGKHISWNFCFLPLTCLSVVALVFVTCAFWGDNATKYNNATPHSDCHQVVGMKDKNSAKNANPTMGTDGVPMDNYTETTELNGNCTQTQNSRSSSTEVLMKVLTNKTIASLAALHIFYLGAEVTFSGWITAFLIEARHGAEERMGYVTTGYWIGLTIGTGVLGYIVGKFKRFESSVAVCLLVLAIAVVIVLWLVPNLAVGAVLAILFGLIIGPVFPTIMIVSFEKMPQELKMTGIGYVTALGGLGCALFPFVGGVLTTKWGIWTFGPYMMVLLSCTLLSWAILFWISRIRPPRPAVDHMYPALAGPLQRHL